MRRGPIISSADLLCAVAIAAAVAPAGLGAAQEADALQLAPAGGWTADFADESCALRRNFSDGTSTILFEMVQFAPGISVEMAVVSSTLAVRRRAPKTAFMPGGEAREHTIFRTVKMDTGEEGFALSETLVDLAAQQKASAQGEDYVWSPADRERWERQITDYFVGEGFEQDFVLQTGSLHAPMNVMRTCLDDLLSTWGLDVAAQHDLSRNVSVDYDAEWFTRMIRRQSDMMKGNASFGQLRARLLVDERGKPTDCRVLDRDVGPRQGGEFCAEMIKTAQFEPALGKDAQPIKSYFLWQRLSAQRRSLAPVRIRVRQ